jgi:hypothetical protein
MKLIIAILQIGKSKEFIEYIFSEKDFDRIESGRLFLKNEERVLKLDDDAILEIIRQINEN